MKIPVLPGLEWADPRVMEGHAPSFYNDHFAMPCPVAITALKRRSTLRSGDIRNIVRASFLSAMSGWNTFYPDIDEIVKRKAGTEIYIGKVKDLWAEVRRWQDVVDGVFNRSGVETLFVGRIHRGSAGCATNVPLDLVYHVVVKDEKIYPLIVTPHDTTPWNAVLSEIVWRLAIDSATFVTPGVGAIMHLEADGGATLYFHDRVALPDHLSSHYSWFRDVRLRGKHCPECPIFKSCIHYL